MESSRFFRPGLTGVRALAAGWVMLFHMNALVGSGPINLDVGLAQIEVTPLFTIGWAGVDLFFVLSGFLLATHLLESAQEKPWREISPDYLRARCRRVFPAYWVQLVILLLVAVVATRTMPAWLAYLPAHAAMVHNYSQQASWAINGVYWTLPIEFAFYLALPTLARILADAEREPGRRRWIVLGVMLASAIAVTWGYRYAVFRMYELSGVPMMVWAISQLPGTIDQFVIGVAAAALLRWWHPGFPAAATQRISTLTTVAGLAGAIGLAYFLHYKSGVFWAGHWTLFAWHTLTAAMFALLVLGIALSSPLARLLFENRVVLFLGTISYSIYLWHFPIALWIKAAPGMQWNRATFALAVIPAVVAVSAASYYLVERRFMARRTVRALETRPRDPCDTAPKNDKI